MNAQRATLKAVADAAGVHVSTASRALNPRTRHLIGEGVVARVLASAAALDYKPNAMARGLRTRRSRGIGVVVPDIANPIFPPILRGIEAALAPHGYIPITVNSEGPAGDAAGHVAMLIGHGVDGLILASPDVRGSGLARAFSGDVPVVVVNREVAAAGVVSVSHEDADGIVQAVAHLVGLGHRRLAHLAGPPEVSTGQARAAAFRAATAEAGIAAAEAPLVTATAYTEEEGHRGATVLLASRPRPTAIVAANDRLAVGALRAIGEAGFVCPADISLTGFNDMPLVDRLAPPLTTVSIRQFEAGFEAGSILLAMLGEAEGPIAPVSLPVRLVVRGSTAPPPSARRQAN